MTERRHRYSERKRLAETGSLGDLTPDPSPELRNAAAAIIKRAFDALHYEVHDAFESEVQHECNEWFGWQGRAFRPFVTDSRSSADDLNDLFEIVVEAGQTVHRRAAGQYVTTTQPWADAGTDFNRIFDRHRYAFRFVDGRIHAVSSPALDDAIVGPALFAVRRAGWQHAERSYLEALSHQRGGPDENDDALTAANAALESALRAMGLEGKTLGELGKNLRSSRFVPAHLAGVPKMIDDLLQRSNAMRSQDGDAHGKAPSAEDVPQSLVNLAINLAGSFIVYLAEVSGAG